MTRIRRILLGCGLAAAAAAGLAAAPEPEPAEPAWLVVYRPGPAWLANRPLSEQPLQEHGRYMLDLHRRGLLRLAGPFADDSGGALVFRAASDRDARAIVEADPAVVERVFAYELRPWKLMPWDEIAARAAR
jgi:uncharacterized protein YciI